MDVGVSVWGGRRAESGGRRGERGEGRGERREGREGGGGSGRGELFVSG